jgi:hypothetical protein
MTLCNVGSCTVFLQYESLNVSANQKIGKMTLYTGGIYMASHQCELLNVCANQMIEKMTLGTEGRNRVFHIQMVSLPYEVLNVSVI